ncbi:MAG: tetratricopeptide repeat protein [Mediterranea massiliensis]|nr:tetratricopeptide repeat protein [Mediterranea massiliensis]
MKRYILALVLAILGINASAQTLAQAKAFFDQKEYEKAKPTYQRLAKANPGNGEYNLRYGICCLKTGEIATAVKHLEIAVKRRTTSGQLWLGQAYNAAYQFEDAINTFEEYIEALEKRKRSTEEAEKWLAKSKQGLRMLKGVEEICVIDSFVVDKSDFLKAYILSKESGEIFFDEKIGNGTVYRNELGNRIYYANQADSTMNIYLSNRRPNGWSEGIPLSENINSGQNTNYPYVLADGITIYYASDGPESLGGYDIFVTRYNDGDYLLPENVGMPFNSPYNDYMYVVDEYSNLAWFASDRFQPEGKVCIYLFVPNPSKQVYNYENMDEKEIIRLALLTPISETWRDKEQVDNARQRFQTLMANKNESGKEEKQQYQFIINDEITYHTANDFQSTEAKALFKQYCQHELDYLHLMLELEQLRDKYSQSNAAQKREKAPAILDLEKRVKTMYEELQGLAKKVRNTELNAL